MEMSIIAIRFVRNFGFVTLIEMGWPLNLEAGIQWLEIFFLNFGVFEGTHLGT